MLLDCRVVVCQGSKCALLSGLSRQLHDEPPYIGGIYRVVCRNKTLRGDAQQGLPC